MILRILFFLLITSSFESKLIFMSTEGNDDSGDGSIGTHYLSLMKCQEVASSGDIVYIRGGTYANFNIAYSDRPIIMSFILQKVV